jgi:aminopeptidase YwaD
MRLSIFFLFLAVNALAQNEALYKILRAEFNESNSYNTVKFVEQYWRLPGNKGFNESIFHVEDILKKAGFQKEISSEAEAQLTYRLESRPMQKPTWEPVDASLSIEGEVKPLLEFKSNRNMLAINSKSTAPEGVTAEVIYVGKGGTDMTALDLTGKIAFGENSGGRLYKDAIAKGAVGVLAYSVPDYNQPTKHVTSISFQGIQVMDTVSQKWCIMLSTEAKDKLQQALSKGKVTVRAKVQTKFYQAEELTLVANVRGSTLLDERFVYSAHVQEPGANDNASGVGTLAEMARVTASLVQSGQFNPNRTLVFLWGDEIRSTARYITENKERAKGIKWGLSLDMVGEDVSKTGGTFLIEKMPDPTAIWTRGEEKHSEWGGSPLTEKDLFPHYFNDFFLSRCLEQAASNDWVVKTNPFEGGSDHTPFLEAKIPGLLMWHFTDVYYHTDGDRLEYVSATEMKNVGVSALAGAYLLTSAGEKITLALIEEARNNALKRLDVEGALSVKAVNEGTALKNEQHIMETWRDFYKKAFEKLNEIHVKGVTPKITAAINAATKSLEDRTQHWIKQVSNR